MSTASRAATPRCSANIRVHVVHCPRSHDYFRHPPFLRERLANAGVNLCLGTDSLATTRKTGKQKPELNMFEEMRALAASDKTISPDGNFADGHRQRRARARPGRRSRRTFKKCLRRFDCDSLRRKNCRRLRNRPRTHSGNVSASMIDGRWAIPPQRIVRCAISDRRVETLFARKS